MTNSAEIKQLEVALNDLIEAKEKNLDKCKGLIARYTKNLTKEKRHD